MGKTRRKRNYMLKEAEGHVGTGNLQGKKEPTGNGGKRVEGWNGLQGESKQTERDSKGPTNKKKGCRKVQNSGSHRKSKQS